MIIRTIVPKLGDSMYYLGKPVMNACGTRIGSISEVIDAGDHYELCMDIPGLEVHSDRDMYACIRKE